jgi:hypothetical protein
MGVAHSTTPQRGGKEVHATSVPARRKSRSAAWLAPVQDSTLSDVFLAVQAWSRPDARAADDGRQGGRSARGARKGVRVYSRACRDHHRAPTTTALGMWAGQGVLPAVWRARAPVCRTACPRPPPTRARALLRAAAIPTTLCLHAHHQYVSVCVEPHLPMERRGWRARFSSCSDVGECLRAQERAGGVDGPFTK